MVNLSFENKIKNMCPEDKEKIRILTNCLRYKYSDKSKDTNVYLFFGFRIKTELITENIREKLIDLLNSKSMGIIDIESEGEKYTCIFDKECIDCVTKEEVDGIPLDVVKFFEYCSVFQIKEMNFIRAIHNILKDFSKKPPYLKNDDSMELLSTTHGSNHYGYIKID